jgi:hypothetical protein
VERVVHRERPRTRILRVRLRVCAEHVVVHEDVREAELVDALREPLHVGHAEIGLWDERSESHDVVCLLGQQSIAESYRLDSRAFSNRGCRRLTQ